ncbi:MAG: hypothetical protein RIG61_08485 [Deltaproteobacteria bacterium]
MIKYGILSVCLVFSSFSFYKAGYAASLKSSDAVLIQSEEYLDYEDWYGPDEAYETDDPGGSTDNEVIPEEEGYQTRTAPDEDTRPKER